VIALYESPGPFLAGRVFLFAERLAATVRRLDHRPPRQFDYIRRAMPYNAPRTFSDSEVYALTAYILSLEGPTLPLPSPALMII
jgi:hypothetical protein